MAYTGIYDNDCNTSGNFEVSISKLHSHRAIRITLVIVFLSQPNASRRLQQITACPIAFTGISAIDIKKDIKRLCTCLMVLSSTATETYLQPSSGKLSGGFMPSDSLNTATIQISCSLEHATMEKNCGDYFAQPPRDCIMTWCLAFQTGPSASCR